MIHIPWDFEGHFWMKGASRFGSDWQKNSLQTNCKKLIGCRLSHKAITQWFLSFTIH